MSIFKSLICLDYYNLRIQNRTREAGTGSVHRIGIVWICNLLTLLGAYLIYFRLNNSPEVVMDLLNQLHYYELAGRVSMMVLLCIIYLIAFTIYGDRYYIQKTLKAYISLPLDKQERIAKRASTYYNYSLILFVLTTGTIIFLFKFQ